MKGGYIIRVSIGTTATTQADIDIAFETITAAGRALSRKPENEKGRRPAVKQRNPPAFGDLMVEPARCSPKPAFRDISTNSGKLKISDTLVARHGQTT